MIQKLTFATPTPVSTKVHVIVKREATLAFVLQVSLVSYIADTNLL